VRSSWLPLGLCRQSPHLGEGEGREVLEDGVQITALRRAVGLLWGVGFLMTKDQSPGLPREEEDDDGLDGTILCSQRVGHLNDVIGFQRDLLEVALRHCTLYDRTDNV
jgi:hypothetical protein